MALFSAKVLAIIGASVIGIGAVATGIGVAVTRNNATAVPEKGDRGNKEDKTDKVQNDDSSKNEMDNQSGEELDATSAINSIQLTDLAFSNVINHSATYAFNVKEVSLSETKTKELTDKGIAVKVSLSNKNSTKDLNEGKLKIEVVTYKTDQDGLLSKLEDEETATEALKDTKSIARKDFDITDFKVADADLVKLLDTTDKSTLDLLKVKYDDRKMDVYQTLDQLNAKASGEITTEPSENGLTKLLRAQKGTSTMPDENTKDVFVTGVASLIKIEAQTDEEQKALFYLSSIDTNNPLKLVKKNGKDTKEALIGAIKTTNLIPNAVNLVPVGFNDQKTEANVENIIKNKVSNGYKVVGMRQNQQIFIKANGGSEDELKPNDLIVNSYVFDNQSTELKELKFNVTLTYGKDEYQTTLNTADSYGVELLKAGGFSFGVYVKKLNDDEMPIDGTKLKAEVDKLTSVFKESSYKTPTNVSAAIESAMVSKAEWKDLTTTPVTVNLETMPANKVDKNKPANLLVFASYSQKGMGDNNSLFSPVLTTIHVEKTQVAAFTSGK